MPNQPLVIINKEFIATFCETGYSASLPTTKETPTTYDFNLLSPESKPQAVPSYYVNND